MNKNERETQEAQTVVDAVAVIRAELSRLQTAMYAVADKRGELYRAVIEPYDTQIASYNKRINALWKRLDELQS